MFQTLLKILILLVGCCLLAGLYRPVLVIWWMSHQNRIRVIRLYGSILLALLLIQWML